MLRQVFIATVIVLCAGFFSCTKTKTSLTKRYPFTGRVISIDRQSQSALIDGDMIQGYMEAMAMSYTFKPVTDFAKLAPGDSISAEVVVVDQDQNPNQSKDASQPDYWLENVKVTQPSKAPAQPAALTEHIPAPGEDVPDFKFTDQNGKNISIAQYRGKLLFLTFIYTRCPFPDYCPRVSNNFAEIYKQMASNALLSEQARLLSVSFDPGHDTPSILRNYGFSVVHSRPPKLFQQWQFAVPTSADLPKIADFFALTYKPEGGLITHSLSTAVIGPDGKIVKWYHGSDWQASDLLQDAAAFLRTPKRTANGQAPGNV